MLDVIIGLSILIGGILLLFSYFYNNPISTQPASFSLEITDFFMSTRFGELAGSNISKWLIDGEVEEDMLIAEKFAILCNESTPEAEVFFQKILNYTVAGAIPAGLGFAVNINFNDTFTCLNYISNSPLGSPDDSSIYMNTRTPIFAIDNGTLVCGGCVMEVALW